MLSDPGPTEAPLYSAVPQLLFGAHSHPAHGVAEHPKLQEHFCHYFPKQNTHHWPETQHSILQLERAKLLKARQFWQPQLLL